MGSKKLRCYLNFIQDHITYSNRNVLGINTILDTTIMTQKKHKIKKVKKHCKKALLRPLNNFCMETKQKLNATKRAKCEYKITCGNLHRLVHARFSFDSTLVLE